MDTGIATQLIIAGATLTGVVLTLLSNAFLERRRARDLHGLEVLRLKSERAKWLRDERQKAYAGLSAAGEDVLQFFRSDLFLVIESGGPRRREEAEARWRALRTELRKTYNQVALFGASDARAAALDVWRTARNGGNDFFHSLQAPLADSAAGPQLSEDIRKAASSFGTAGDRFEACRADLQAESNGTAR